MASSSYNKLQKQTNDLYNIAEVWSYGTLFGGDEVHNTESSDRVSHGPPSSPRPTLEVGGVMNDTSTKKAVTPENEQSGDRE